MPYQLTFNVRCQYSSLESGIPLEATLRRGNNVVHCKARIDTGAQYCLFSREIGEDLGLDVESGLRSDLGTLAGNLTVFGHEVTLETLGLVFYTVVFFSESRNLPRNLLGRTGWLQLLRLAIVDYDNEIYLSPYDNPATP